MTANERLGDGRIAELARLPGAAEAPVMQPREVNEEGAVERMPDEGIALCLSGGGYRAMLFHLGALIRLNECGVLAKLERVSSVSGGSITAAALGLKWPKLQFDAAGVSPKQTFLREVVEPIRELASTTIDRGAVLGGILLPGSVSDRVAAAYDKHLFNNATLRDLPDDANGPRFVINATSVQTGALVRFSRPYLADYKVGRILSPKISLARAVAASSAFPPVLSPTTIDVSPEDFEADPNAPLQKEPFVDELVLTDGGVYDNLGLETAWKRYRTILVSDGGGLMAPDGDPDHDWARHSKRILDIIDNQVRSLRKRQLIASYMAAETDTIHRQGAYWGIRTDIEHYGDSSPPQPPFLDCPSEKTRVLANTPTRLKRMPKSLQNRLMNWGYAVTDAAIRRHAPEVIATDPGDPAFPFSGGVG